MAGFVCPCCGEVTNVFSKGGGELMAREWGVKFLGSVPLDGEGWGMLVEEGKRPVYGRVAATNGDEAQAQEEEQMVEAAPLKNEGLLVERYTSCSLFPIFDQIVAKVENDEGTVVGVPSNAG